VSLAQQIEASYLAAYEKFDAESYTFQKAQQDLDLATANKLLQDKRVTEAVDGVTLAGHQQDRAQFQADHYQGLVDGDLNGAERASLDLMWAEAGLQAAGGTLYAIAAATGTLSLQNLFTSGSSTFQEAAQGLSYFASAAGTEASLWSQI